MSVCVRVKTPSTGELNSAPASSVPSALAPSSPSAQATRLVSRWLEETIAVVGMLLKFTS